MTIKKVLKRIILLIFLAALIAVACISVWAYFTYGQQILALYNRAERIAKTANEGDFKSAQTTLIYTSDGTLISTLKTERDTYYLDIAQIPQAVVDAFISTEDHSFYTHSGYDLLANVRAARALIKNKGEIHQGASTITQQLARTIYLTNDVTFERKITEIFLAAALEKKFSKDKIMEYYINNIYFANGYYGIQAAAYGYFSDSVEHLSLSKIVFLCAIVNNPSMFDPYVHYDDTIERSSSVLDQMQAQGKISVEEAKQAKRELIVLNPSASAKSNYMQTYAVYSAINDLMSGAGFLFRNVFESNADREAYNAEYRSAYIAWQHALYTHGYRIYTSFDLSKQQLLQETLDSNLGGFDAKQENGVYALQGAAACIDNETGLVVAAVGGRQQDEITGLTLNRAYQSFRQLGSAIKPLVIYTPWFDKGLYPSDTVMDAPFEGGPRNSGGQYDYETTVRRAVELSANTVAWKLFMEMTPEIALSYLLRMDFSHIVPQDYVPAASLGGLTYGVSAVEAASAYATIANIGMFRRPSCIAKITDAQGNVVVDNKKYAAARDRRVYGTNASVAMTDVLRGVLTRGTGRRIELQYKAIAGKTGTTLNGKDGWFCGYSAYYTTAVWVGDDMPETVEGLAGNTFPAYIFADFMNEIHAGLPEKPFAEYIEDKAVTGEIWGEKERDKALEATRAASVTEAASVSDGAE